MKIADYLDPRLIAFLSAKNRDQAIHSLIDLLNEQGYLPDSQAFTTAIFQREELVSTGIGMGVAIPHAKMEGLPDFFIALGIQQEKSLDWKSQDGAPVRLIFLIGGPSNEQTEYLQLLSLLTSAIRDIDLRKKLVSATSQGEVFSFFSHLDAATGSP